MEARVEQVEADAGVVVVDAEAGAALEGEDEVAATAIIVPVLWMTTTSPSSPTAQIPGHWHRDRGTRTTVLASWGLS